MEKKEDGASLSPGMQLIMLSRGKVASSRPLGEAPITIGRGEENTVCLPDERASRRHAVVVIREGRVVVEDLNSSNGTWVNERKVSLQELRPGDTVRVGRTVFMYVVVRPAAMTAGWVIARTLTGEQVVLPLAERPLVIGSSEQADIRLPGIGLEEFHASVVAQPGAGGAPHAAELVLLTGLRPRRIPLPDGVDVPVGAMIVKFQTTPPTEASAVADRLPHQAPAAPGKPRASKTRDESIHIRPIVGDLTLMGAIHQEVERAERTSHAQKRPLKPRNDGPSTDIAVEDASEGLHLTITKGARTGATFFIGKEMFTIGREAACDLRLDDPKVAPQHAWIRTHANKALIEDLGTPGGTYVNGHRVRRHTIAAGDTIRIGEHELLAH